MKNKEIRELAELMKEMDLTSLEISEGDSVIKLERSMGKSVPAAACNLSETTADANHTNSADKGSKTVMSPMVGVFYATPAPETKPFVSVGDTVHTGDVLCIIEAMKMMNEITSDTDGVIEEICVGDKQLVDFGHPLFRIKNSSAGG